MSGVRVSHLGPECIDERRNTENAALLCGVQSVEEPGLYSGADWIWNIYERKNSKAKRG